jgi:glycosyltransferase involved in cell wall biosynthesis
MNPPLFSLVIPTHNRVALVERALRSVAAQSFGDYEIIVVDDGSSDATPAFLASVRGPRCNVIRNEAGHGASAARNQGVAAAAGEIIAFLDDDDELRPFALEALHERYVATPRLDFAWGGRLIHQVDADGRLIENREDDWRALPTTLSDSTFLNLVLSIATSSAFTVRRSVFQTLGGFDEQLRMSEDRDLFIRLAQGRYLGAGVARTVIDVYERTISLSRSTGRRAGAEIDLSVIEKHREYLQLPQHRDLLERYLLAVFVGFLEAGNRAAAMRTLGQLGQRRALNMGVVRKYVRHAPEFRSLKRWLRYDSLRRLRNNLRKAKVN